MELTLHETLDLLRSVSRRAVQLALPAPKRSMTSVFQLFRDGMDMIVFDVNQHYQALRDLSRWKRIAFMALCCERMLPNFSRFSVETGFGDVSVLRQALDVVWRWLETGEVDANVASLRRECDQQAPNTENFSSLVTSAALDAANAVSITLHALCKTGDAEPDEVATLARDTIDLYVQETSSLSPAAKDFEASILEHDLMQAELSRQQHDLQELGESRKPRAVLVRELREYAERLGAGSLTEPGQPC